MQQILTTIFLVVYTVTILGVVLVIITDNRNPLKTLPWILVLILAPGAGLFFYFFFGQNLSKQRIISRRTRKRITMQLEEVDTAGGPAVPQHHLPLSRLLRQTAHAVPLYGSRITPYVEGGAKMDALLEAVGSASHHIHVQYYIFCDDDTGRRLRDALVAKAREGVEVRVLYDDVGCMRVKKAFFESMRAAGIEVCAFLHVKFPLLTSKVNYRNHRKIAVVDGLVGFIGGMNVADRYVRGTAQGVWRDTHFRVEGCGVAGLQASFLSDWSATTRQNVSGPAYYPAAGRFTDNIMQVVASGPFGKWRTLLQADSFAVSRAARRIWIETPYCLPSDALNMALQEAALAGVDVRLMLPGHSDSRVVDLAGRSYLDDLMKAGVKIAFYTPGFLHSKLLIVDDDLAVIGSANMDFRSFEHNFEVSAFVYDRDFNARMAAVYEDDLRQCRMLSPGEWFNRPRTQRWAESFMRVFSPLL
ncbi:cardiolipin synthase [uncultured Alistipes sp.]|jgi:cardiolipin synthase|uniref:cardiolipin synthase n=1 Tax=uncultured Alistipes sp. TaxID=538949 RepID=UPI0023C43496|nr:cardiolipin synthase [uncultured Alistipes sp.]MDE7005771.1 cardiolipin synthase [Alistipes sp.]